MKSKQLKSSNIIFYIALTLSILLIAGCSKEMGDSFKYMFTGETGTPPPRTIDAAKAQFNDSKLVVGHSSVSDVERLLGSPMEIKKTGNNRIYVYLKSVETSGVSTDVGTNYIASYTINSKGKLASKNYKAYPMSNPLLQ